MAQVCNMFSSRIKFSKITQSLSIALSSKELEEAKIGIGRNPFVVYAFLATFASLVQFDDSASTVRLRASLLSVFSTLQPQTARDRDQERSPLAKELINENQDNVDFCFGALPGLL